VAEIWEQIGTDNLKNLSGFEGYQKDFMKLFGFGLEGVDYGADTNPVRSIDLVE
jgi:enoyl-[acyl-carrier protein] reductase/trans-2-enoyl-CoA reductase (NAD+)